MIPKCVEQKLSDDLWIRPSDVRLNEAFSKLSVSSYDGFAEFFRRYWGPFRSDCIGHELLDVVEQDETVLSNTDTARREFDFADNFIVISSLCALSVLVYDVESGAVYDVDFEGGDELLKAGRLAARWQSWEQFLIAYFS